MPDYSDYVELSPNSLLEKRVGDAGFDLVAASVAIPDFEFKFIEYETDFAFAPAADYVHALILPRSSISKTWLSLANAPALIDSSFRGRVKLIFRYFGDFDNIDYSKIYKKGDKISQVVFFEEKRVELIESDNLGNTNRGSGGFGSTGK